MAELREAVIWWLFQMRSWCSTTADCRLELEEVVTGEMKKKKGVSGGDGWCLVADTLR